MFAADVGYLQDLYRIVNFQDPSILDSLEPGALDEGRPLHGIGNLQITPRLASTTRESRLRSAWAVARRIDELLMATPVAPPEFRPTAPGEPLDLAAEPESP